MLFEELAERDAHFLFDIAGLVHMARNAEELGAGVVRTAETGEPVGTTAQDSRGDRNRLHVVHRGRRAVETDIRRERRLEARHALLALKAFEEGGFFAADIGACAVMNVEIEVPAGARRVRPQETGFVCLVHSSLELLALADEFAAHIDVAGMRAHREGGDEAAFDELLRIVTHDVAILAGAGLGLVRVHHEIMRTAIGLLRHEGPFEAGREARAATTAQTRLLHLVENPVTSLGDDCRRTVPVATLFRGFETPVMEAVKIREYAVLVFQHQLLPPVCGSPTVVRLVRPPAGSDA